MRLAFAALLALAPLPALADAAVGLRAGHDYMLAGVSDGDATVTLAAPGGAVVASVQVPGGDDIQRGDEFRAAYSATYTLRVNPADAGTAAFVEPDCRASPATLCHISVNHTRRGKFSASYDGDWFAATLLAGRVYRIAYSGGLGALVGVRDARGRDLVPEQDMVTAGTLTFRPRAKGRYFISVQFDDFAGSGSPFYTLGLR